MKYSLSFLFIICSLASPLFSVNARPQDDPLKTIVIVTIPKCGTNLIKKAVEMILQNKRFEEFVVAHLHSKLDYIKNDHSGRYIKIVQIRDLRDMIISQMFWMESHGWWLKDVKIKKFRKLPVDKKIEFIIQMPDEDRSPRLFARRALEWMKDPSVFVSRFEDLIGEQGGGDRKLQEKTLQALAVHLECELTEEEIRSIADNLFGDSTTFRKGLIGEYKNYFKPYHNKIFNEIIGQEFLNLGYKF